MPGKEGIGTWPTPEKRMNILRWIREMEQRLRKIRELLEADEPKEPEIEDRSERKL